MLSDVINEKEFARKLKEETRQAVTDYIEFEMISRGNDENIKLLQRPAFFRGLLKYIALRIFQPIGKKPFLKTGPAWQVLAAWNEYTDLCSNFGQAPVLELFCDMVGIRSQNIRRWAAGDRYIYDAEPGSENTEDLTHNDVALMILESIKGIYKDKIINENQYNTVFLLKNEYGYTEHNTINITAKEKTETPQQIAAKHAALLDEKK